MAGEKRGIARAKFTGTIGYGSVEVCGVELQGTFSWKLVQSWCAKINAEHERICEFRAALAEARPRMRHSAKCAKGNVCDCYLARIDALLSDERGDRPSAEKEE
jgi:hypothetical protein